MKIAIMSDSHDSWDNLVKAIELSNEVECEYLLFAGDLASPPGIAILEKFIGEVKFVWGNNEGEKVAFTRKLDLSNKIELCDNIYEATLDNIKVFMNHYPRISELAARSGEFDLCIYGHDHTYKTSEIGKTLLINPGAISSYSIDEATFIIFDTATSKVKKVVL